MKITKLTTKEISALVLLAFLVAGVIYYLAFYKPMQADLSALAAQSVDLDNQIAEATAKATNMKSMQDEIDKILSQPKTEITEIAPYDNKEVVFNLLNGILMRTVDYALNFADPEIQPDGFVRRNVSMSFNCANYEEAKAVIQDLTKSNWRCLVSNCTIIGEESMEIVDEDGETVTISAHGEEDEDEETEDTGIDMLHSPVSVSATITFFESEKLAK